VDFCFSFDIFSFVREKGTKNTPPLLLFFGRPFLKVKRTGPKGKTPGSGKSFFFVFNWKNRKKKRKKERKKEQLVQKKGAAFFPLLYFFYFSFLFSFPIFSFYSQ